MLHQPPAIPAGTVRGSDSALAALCLFFVRGAMAEGCVEKGLVKEEQEGVGGCLLQLQHCDVVGAANTQYRARHKEGLLGSLAGPVPAQVEAVYPQLALGDGDETELCSPPSSPLLTLCRLTLLQPGNFTKVSQAMPGVSKVPV